MDDLKVEFKFREFNKRRWMRGASAARFFVKDSDGGAGFLWMSRADIGRNMISFGRCEELQKGISAYAEMG